MSITHQVFVEPSAIAVELPEPQVVLCIEVLGAAGLKIHRTTPAAAMEQITELLPRIIIVARSLDAPHREMIDDRAVAVGAVVAELDAAQDFASIEKALHDAVNTWRTVRGKAPRFT